MERVFPVERTLTRVVRPVLRRVTSLPVAGEEVFEAVRRFYDRLEGVRSLLTDADMTSVRLVVNPERMVIAEARRTATYLSLFGYHVDAVLPLPFADRHAVELGRRDCELLVRVGSYRRAVVLPDSLRRREVTGAAMVDGWLEIGFDHADSDSPDGMSVIRDWEGEIEEEAL
jgi:anion-transporting  ArsA/GET3 family ATPase